MSYPDDVAKDALASRSEALRPDLSFPRSCRLTARRQFIEVYEKGRRMRSTYFTLFGLPNRTGMTRLGITVKRQAGGAVVRNRIKRVMRDIYRRNRPALQLGLDLVVNARSGMEKAPYARLEGDFLNHLAEMRRSLHP